MPFTPEVIDHFEHPRHAGDLPGADVVVRVENPVCGDILELSAVLHQTKFSSVSFKAKGCVAAMAAGSAITELLSGKDFRSAADLKREHVIQALGGLSPESMHVSHLAIDGVRALISAAKNRA
jgi:nitrogen fixation protein NifU and related proteins